MVAPCKLIIRVLFVILLIFMVQGNAAPIPFERREVSSGLSRPGPQSSSQDSTSFLSHGPQDHSVPEAAVGVVHVPDSHEDKPSNERKASQNDDHSTTFDKGDSGPATPPETAELIQAHLQPLREYPRLHACDSVAQGLAVTTYPHARRK
ncbi:hypothetical protein JB92DRAFT_3091811 [Gautieria morchelliformis]|nr:hypothetical protein JB92DRAFT_3091811 [Gautieria morchelliformis]